MNEKKLDTYRTTDIYLSSILVSEGAQLISCEIKKEIDRQAVFTLDVSNLKHEAIIREYHMGTYMIEVKGFVQTFKGLKNVMFSKLNEE